MAEMRTATRFHCIIADGSCRNAQDMSEEEALGHLGALDHDCVPIKHNEVRTIEEVCRDEDMVMPTTQGELEAFVQECDARGIETNVSNEQWWKDARFSRRRPTFGVCCPNHPEKPAASPSSNLCGPCLMGREVTHG